MICHGPWLLVSADLVRGAPPDVVPLARRGRPQRRRHWVDEEVVVDRNLITSRNPDDLPAFVKALEDALA